MGRHEEDKERRKRETSFIPEAQTAKEHAPDSAINALLFHAASAIRRWLVLISAAERAFVLRSFLAFIPLIAATATGTGQPEGEEREEHLVVTRY